MKTHRLGVPLLAAALGLTGTLQPLLALEKGEISQGTEIEPLSSLYDQKTVKMYRIYNPNSGEHFYTGNLKERQNLEALGWQYEGCGWIAPGREGDPVYRLYNSNAGDHHYTLDERERSYLVAHGWKDEGIGWRSASSDGIPLYRQYNPNAKAGSHNYTADWNENSVLGSYGWRLEGISWYGLAMNKAQGTYGYWGIRDRYLCSVDYANRFTSIHMTIEPVRRNGVIVSQDLYVSGRSGILSEPVPIGNKTWEMTVVSSSSTDPLPSLAQEPAAQSARHIYPCSTSRFAQGHTIYWYERGKPKNELPDAVRRRPISNAADQSASLETDVLYDVDADVVMYEGYPGIVQ